jgi:hypothetical protein
VRWFRRGHQAVRQLGQDLSRSETLQILMFNSVQEHRAGCPEDWVCSEVIDERVGIDKDGSASEYVGKDHSLAVQG